MASPDVEAIVSIGSASASLAEPAAAPCGSVDGRQHANVLHPARSPRNARLAAEAGVHVRLGGISTAAILAAINAGAQRPTTAKASLWAATLFVIVAFPVHQDAGSSHHHDHRRDRSHHPQDARAPHGSVRHSELLAIEEIGRSRIVAAITSDTAVLTQASNMLCFSMQGAVLIFFVAIYVAYLSLAAIRH